jgi:hypothetical protein
MPRGDSGQRVQRGECTAALAKEGEPAGGFSVPSSVRPSCNFSVAACGWNVRLRDRRGPRVQVPSRQLLYRRPGREFCVGMRRNEGKDAGSAVRPIGIAAVTDGAMSGEGPGRAGRLSQQCQGGNSEHDERFHRATSLTGPSNPEAAGVALPRPLPPAPPAAAPPAPPRPEDVAFTCTSKSFEPAFNAAVTSQR